MSRLTSITFQFDDAAENGEMSEVEADDSSSSSSDITIECDEIHGPNDDKDNMDLADEITQNDEEEISAL